MRILLIIITSLTFLFSGPLIFDNWSIGISETIGFYGMWNLNYNLNNSFYITMGSFAIPIMGRTGFGAKYNLPSFTIPSLITNGHSPLISPYYIRCRIWSLYASLMCEQNSTNNCEMKHDVIFNSSMGLGLYLARISKAVVHLEEVSILYSLKNNALIESPSDDISELWPFINIKFGK